MTTAIRQTKTSGLAPSLKRTLWGGLLFSLAFTALIWWGGQSLDRSTFAPDQGASWYFWQLPNPTFWTRATAWGLYAAHQLAMWGLITYAQTRVKRTINGVHNVNWIALGINAFFIVLHFIQTQIWYDGLAQDVSIWSSQGSVILMLVMILIMENRRRGMFWGKKAPISKAASDFVRTYHGYVFAWATVYTFWYHPAESTVGHLVGFLYMFLLLLQGSLIYTRVHTNRWWMLVQEVMVLFHGTLVAVMQGNGLWPMFFFGFGGMFVITQMHGLRLPKWATWAVLVAYVGGVVVTYSQLGWARINEIVRIPIIEYLAAILLAGLIALALRVFKRTPRLSTEEGVAA